MFFEIVLYKTSGTNYNWDQFNVWQPPCRSQIISRSWYLLFFSRSALLQYCALLWCAIETENLWHAVMWFEIMKSMRCCDVLFCVYTSRLCENSIAPLNRLTVSYYIYCKMFVLNWYPKPNVHWLNVNYNIHNNFWYKQTRFVYYEFRYLHSRAHFGRFHVFPYRKLYKHNASCSGPISAQNIRGSVLGVVFSYTMHKIVIIPIVLVEKTH